MTRWQDQGGRWSRGEVSRGGIPTKSGNVGDKRRAAQAAAISGLGRYGVVPLSCMVCGGKWTPLPGQIGPLQTSSWADMGSYDIQRLLRYVRNEATLYSGDTHVPKRSLQTRPIYPCLFWALFLHIIFRPFQSSDPRGIRIFLNPPNWWWSHLPILRALLCI